MFDLNYKATGEEVWVGRVDSDTNYDAFRWHQWVKKIDLRNDDLNIETGKLGIAFIGFCCDEGVKRNMGRPGAANGPQNIRRAMANLPCRFTQDVLLYDAGDILCENGDMEGSQNLLAHAVDKLLSLNLFPIVLGGGHEVALGNYKGVLKNKLKSEDKPNIGIINFDAHFDLRPTPAGGSSGTMFRQIAGICEEQQLKYSYFCMGIQKNSNTIDLFKTADRLGVQYILAKDMMNSDDWSMLERLDDFMKYNDHVYLTICTDVFSSAFAPGVSATQPLGLEPERALKLIKYILRSDKVVSFDIAEVSPRFDLDNTTANLAKVLIFAVVDTLAQMRHLAL